MKLVYNRKHLHISVGTAAMLGMALGFWLGTRIDSAGFLESFAVVIGFVVVSRLAMAKVDEMYLPKQPEPSDPHR